MKAVVIEQLTGPSAAHVADVPEPVGAHFRANGHRVLVQVHSAGLSFVDHLQSRGLYQTGAPLPYISGSEVAGLVVEADPGSGFEPGDRVGSIVWQGAMAEKVMVPPDYTLRLPDSMSFAQGASLYMNYGTAWYAYHRAGVRPGETVLIHGASGGVGTAALDLAPAFGARTIGVVSTAHKAAVARECGADEVVRSDENWLQQVVDLTGGRGVQVLIDPVGGDRFTDSLRALAIGGRLVVVGFTGGSIPTVKVNRLLLRNLTVTGIAMDTMELEHPGTLRMVRDAVQQLADDGALHPLIGAHFALEDAAEALASLEERTAVGKVVIDVRP
jgi:NADPH2:quinone reductase